MLASCHRPRPVSMLLAAGDRGAALNQLDSAWDDYNRMGAWASRASVQRQMRRAGARGGVSGQTEAERTDR